MRKERILVVDDSEPTAEMLMRALESLGHEPLGMAARPAEALRLAERLRPDLVLMDVNLSESFDGIGAAEMLHEQLGIRSILITGMEVSEVLPRAHRAAPLGYLHKPFNTPRLESAIAMALHVREVQAQLTANRETLAAMLNAADDGFMVADRQGRILEANDAASGLTGISHDDLVRTTLAELVTTRSSAAAAEEMERQRRSGGRISTCRWRNANGADIEFTVRADAASGARLICLLRNVTSHVKADETVRTLSRAVEHSPVSVVITDVAGTIQYVNPRFCAVTGYSAAEAIGQNPRLLKSGRQSDLTYRQLWAAISSGREWHGEFHNRRKNGELFWESASISAVRDADGTITHFVGIKEDITEQKRIARDLEVRESYLSAIIENQPGPVWLKDITGRYLAANRAYIEFCVPQLRKELLGCTLQEVWPAELAEPLQRVDDQLLSGLCDNSRFCIELPNPAGGTIWAEMYKSVACDSAGKPIGIVGSARDITAEKQTAAELIASTQRLERVNGQLRAAVERERELAHAADAASRAKSAFLASMSHELRTPLNVINGLSATLRRQSKDERTAHSAGLILECGQHLLSIIQEILDYSVLQAGRPKLDIKPHALVEIVAGALRQAAVTARDKALELSCWLPPHLPATLVTDGRRLQQILLNLLQNAVKFTDRGGVHLSVSSRSLPDGTVAWCFTVFDSGIGISREGLSKLFQPFSQGTGEIGRSYGGTGLGLVISQSFAQLMGGDVRARSIAGRGSCFRCSIRTPALETPASVADLAPAAASGQRVALVGRNTRTRRFLAATLTGWGLRPHVCSAAEWAALPNRAHLPAVIEHGEIDPLRAADAPAIWYERCGSTRDIVAPPGALALPIGLPELRDALARILVNPDQASSSSSAVAVAEPAVASTLAERVPLQILAADDIFTNREVVREILRMLGYAVTLVNDGAQALAALERNAYDLVLLDVQMPVMDGLTAAREIHLRYPSAHQRPKLVALTAGALPGDRAACLDAGMDDYLAKPVLPDAIEQCILRLFRNAVRAAPVAPAALRSALAPVVDEAHLNAAIPPSLGPARGQILRAMRNAAVLDFTTLHADLQRACADHDYVLLAKTLHALKGCFLTVGWKRLAERCALHLAAVRERAFAGWTTLPEEVRALFEESSEAMQRYVDEAVPLANGKPAVSR